MKMKLREPINSITHIIGAFLGLIALIAMVTKVSINQEPYTATISVIIFGFSMILLYGVSGTYHGVVSSDKVIKTLQKLDHSMIFLLIAGSYAPFCLITLSKSIGLFFFCIMIIVSILGIIFKICWFNSPRWLQTGLYIGIGWSAIFVIKPLYELLPTQAFILLVIGGILYTIGGIIYGLKPKKLKFGKFEFHEIFHIFILLGSLSHFICVYTYLL